MQGAHLLVALDLGVDEGPEEVGGEGQAGVDQLRLLVQAVQGEGVPQLRRLDRALLLHTERPPCSRAAGSPGGTPSSLPPGPGAPSSPARHPAGPGTGPRGAHLHDARLQLLHGLGLLAVHGGAHLPPHQAVLVQRTLVLVQHALLVPLTQVLWGGGCGSACLSQSPHAARLPTEAGGMPKGSQEEPALLSPPLREARGPGHPTATARTWPAFPPQPWLLLALPAAALKLTGPEQERPRLTL